MPNFSMNTLPAELTVGTPKKGLTFPYFYYMSGGGRL